MKRVDPPFDDAPYLTCADTINMTLTNLMEFENTAAQTMLTIPTGSEQCSTATMNPQFFIFSKSDWNCATNYSLDRDKICYKGLSFISIIYTSYMLIVLSVKD